MIKIIFTSSAEVDLRESLNWYENQYIGLGGRFIKEIDIHISRIQKNPNHYPEVLPKIRRANLNRFPYSIFFVVNNDNIAVIAVFHNSRDPQIWITRK